LKGRGAFTEAHRGTLGVAGGVLVLLWILWPLMGCGYRHEADGYPADIRSVAVAVFENRSFYRDLEFDVTEALIKQIERDTPYKVVSGSIADSVLTGAVVRVRQDLVSRSEEGGVPQEVELRVVVNFDWTDGRTGQVLRSRQGLEATGRYIPVRRIGQPRELAEQEAAQRMAEAIVAAMRSDW
jgi:hypothetical protein